MNFGNESTKNKSLHDNDVVVRNSMCVHDLVGVAHVRLVVEDFGKVVEMVLVLAMVKLMMMC